MIGFGLAVIFSLLLPVALLAAVAWITRASRRGSDGDDRPGWSLRRLLQYSFLLGVLVAAGNGVALVVRAALPRADRLAGTGLEELALGLSLAVVAGPAWAALWRVVRRRLRADPEERASAAWSLYLTAATAGSLIAVYVDLVALLGWLLRVEDYSSQALAGALVWGAVWLLHWWLLRRPGLEPSGALGDLPVLVGSAVGAVGLAIGAGGVLSHALDQVYRAVTGAAFAAADPAEVLRRSASIALVGGAVWAWHWLRHALRARRTTVWHVYVMVVPILGGLLWSVWGAALLLHALLEALVGPAGPSFARRFDVLPEALAALVLGGAAWLYHRAVLGESGDPRRAEPERAYEYLVTAVALAAAGSGIVIAITGAIQAVTPAFVAGADPLGRETMVDAVTLLLVGVPLWGLFWRRSQRRALAGAASGDTAELTSRSRRAYLFLLFGAVGVTAVIGLVGILFVFLRDLLLGSLGWWTLHELRTPIALSVTAGAVSAYHWAVYRGDRAAAPAVQAQAVRTVLLVGPDGRALGEQVAERTGARVRTLQRLDTPPVAVDVEAVAEAVIASAHDRILVLLDEAGGVRVIPYETS